MGMPTVRGTRHRAERFHVQDMYWGSEGDEGSVSMEDYGSDYFDEMGSSSLSGGMSAGSQSWISWQ